MIALLFAILLTGTIVGCNGGSKTPQNDASAVPATDEDMIRSAAIQYVETKHPGAHALGAAMQGSLDDSNCYWVTVDVGKPEAVMVNVSKFQSVSGTSYWKGNTGFPASRLYLQRNPALQDSSSSSATFAEPEPDTDDRPDPYY